MLLKCCNRRQASSVHACFVPGIQGSEYADGDSKSSTHCTLAERVPDIRAPELSACSSLRGV
jgi:hypothetical protein